jgi:hypothetical protein
MTMKERKEFERELAAYVEEKVAKLKKQLARAQSVKRGDAIYVAKWREPYKEKKIRSYRGYWMHIVQKKPATVAMKRAA